MSDERGRGARDEGRPDPDEPTEPEFGRSDWLLQQLTGGRHVEREADAPTAAMPTVEPTDERRAEPVDAPVATPSGPQVEPEAGRFDDLLAAGSATPEAEEPVAEEFPVAFSWNLTPGSGGDPLAEPEPAPAAEPAMPEPEPVRDPAPLPASEPVEPAPLVPPVYGSPLAETFDASPTAEESVGDAPAHAMEGPVEEPPAAVRSWVIPTPEPQQPAEPEPPRTIFDAPPAAPTADSESHGLAALLGFGASESDATSGRSVIGDTTSIIRIDPAALTPPPAAEPPSVPSSPPPVDTSADVPTQQLDAAEIAALLRDGRDDSAAVLPSQPAVPAAEAELALGGVPSPATSAIDAQSLAAASEPEPFDATATGSSEVDDEDSDGLAALFGDVEPEPEPESAPESEPEPEPEPAMQGEADRDTALLSVPEPAADLEGPQLPAAMPFSPPPPAVEEPPADPYAHGSPPRFTPLATAVAPVVASDSVATASSAAALPASPAAGSGTGAPAGPGAPAAPEGGPGIWGSRNNRILLLALAALAVVLVLVGLFALGTRIPSLFGAAKSEPQPTTSATPGAASPTPTPTPTPVPTVTPKPAAAVGAGTHPWDALGGGECIQPFTTVWAQQFTVVDCTTPHTAQLVYTNLLSADPAAPYPGADALAQQMPGLCTAAGVVDLGAAAAYPDLQVVGSFPATEQQWKSGQRAYYCFANRSSGQPLTTSVAGPGPSA